MIELMEKKKQEILGRYSERIEKKKAVRKPSSESETEEFKEGEYLADEKGNPITTIEAGQKLSAKEEKLFEDAKKKEFKIHDSDIEKEEDIKNQSDFDKKDYSKNPHPLE